jgi:hypothetical protein
MKKILFLSFIFFSTTVFADNHVEKQAITLVNEFLTYLQNESSFSYDKEIYFFGEHSFPSFILCLQEKLVNDKGEWLTTMPKDSLIGKLLKKKKNLFFLPSKTQRFIFCKKDDNTNSCFVICTEQKQPEKSQLAGVTNSPMSKTLVFRVNNFTKPYINLLESTIDGMNILYLLDFRLKNIDVKSAGKIKRKTILIFDSRK